MFSCVLMLPHWFVWLLKPKWWAVLWFFSLCPGCGLVLSLAGILDFPVCGVWLLSWLLVLVNCGSVWGFVSG